MTSITIPDSVTSIGRLAFRDCCSLTSVTIPDGVKTIEFAAFRNCVKLGSITIGKGLEAMEQSVFQECRATKMILMSRLLSKTSVKGCLKGSNIRTVVVNVGSKTANRRCVRKYKKIFTTKNVGRKVRVK